MTLPPDIAQQPSGALVWDMVWAWEPWIGNSIADLGRYAGAGYKVISATIAGDNHNVSQAMARVAEFRAAVAAGPTTLALCSSIESLHAAMAAGKLAVLMHFEGTRCFERSTEIMESFYALGVRHTLLAFNNANSAGSGCMESSDGGLTRFGKRLVTAMERVGMVLDLSHTGHRTAREAMSMATRPCMFSHANAHALFPHPRNITDDEIKLCAELRGVIGISGSSMYHGDWCCSPQTIFSHIDYVVQLAGADYVGLGLDSVTDPKPLDGYMRSRPDEWPEAQKAGWSGVRFMQPEAVCAVTELMRQAGYGDVAIRKILGENFLRLCTSVWR